MLPEAQRNETITECYIVGLGASAGGYEALETFFANMPPDSGMAFVVVQHLSPDYKSLMVELLSKHTQMKVERVEDGVALRPNTVYLIPPKKTMTIFQRKLFLSEINTQHGLHLPINIFFRSLAEDVQAKAIGIILSGTGSDGTLGIRDIKGAGGFVLVQEPMSAKFDGMPKSALASRMVDYVLEPESMPELLVKFVNQLYITQQSVNNIMRGSNVDTLTQILFLIKQQKDFDFTQYKPTTIIRRIEKRMGINQVNDVDDYVNLLQSTPAEVNILAGDLLINVTKFFREPEAFDFLKAQVLPSIFSQHKANTPIRVWVAPCSTGEEAYSLAMIFREYMEEQGREMEVKIFATDIDRPSLETASAGIYPESIVADVSEERLAKYFTRKNHTFQVNKILRSMVIFAYQNILKDAPFNKIDLITCRNLLIYFQEQAQRSALSYMHFALNKDSFLFLGKSETVGEMVNYFTTVNTTWKIFRKVGNQPLALHDRQDLFASKKRPSSLIHILNAKEKPEAEHHDPFEKAYQRLMRSYEPAAILINSDNDVLYYFGNMAHFLATPHGKAEQNVLKVLRPDLAIAVSTAIHRVRKEKKEVMYTNIVLRENDLMVQFDLIVKPAVEQSKTVESLFVIFEEVLSKPENAQDSEIYDQETQSTQRIKDLESELQITKENLQATVEELETSNEELQATNEELLAANEELQSTNEELQSVNEELITVNSEYQGKFEELIRMTNDFDNLLNSTQIAMLFLDRDLLIRKFTPKITALLNIVDTDVGRPIGHLTMNIAYETFQDDLQQVLHNGHLIETEIRAQDQTWYLLRILPYYELSDDIEGVTVSLVDIHDRKQAEESLKAQHAFAKTAFERMARVGTWEWDISIDTMKWSTQVYSIFGRSSDSFPGTYEAFLTCVHPDDRSEVRTVMTHCLEHCDEYRQEHRILHPDGAIRWVLEVGGRVIRDADDKPAQMFGIVQDITQYKQFQSSFQEAESPPLRIWLIEDDMLDIKILQRVLLQTRIHAESEVFQDGETVFARLHEEEGREDANLPGLMILDMNLPGMSGPEILTKLKQHPAWKRIPVLIVTGSQLPESILQAYHLESNAYLTKPYTSDLLIVAINAALDSHWFVIVKKQRRTSTHEKGK